MKKILLLLLFNLFLLLPFANAQIPSIGGEYNANASNQMVTATGGNTARTNAAINADISNVMGFGADPSGNTSSDNSVAINAAAVATRNGSIANVYLPVGTYHVKNASVIGSTTQSQCLVGDPGGGTIIDIDSDFSPSASGVIVITGANASTVVPCVRNIQFVFHQPADIVTTTTANTTAGNNTITVSSVTGINVGMVVLDTTTHTAIPTPVYGLTTTVPTVTAINPSTKVVTLSINVNSPGVGNGDTVQFASSRAQFAALGSCTTTVGGTGCKYPWAIYSNGTTQDLQLDNITINAGWDGIYERGQTFHMGTIFIGTFDQGLNIDSCHNFPQIDDYVFWNFGIDKGTQSQTALSTAYYDGTNVAANLGATDGLAAGHFQIWDGIVNLTANWSWGSFDSISLDGSQASLNVLSTSSVGRVQISKIYATTGGAAANIPIYVNPTQASFVTNIDDIYVSSQFVANYNIDVEGGTLSISNGTINKSVAGANAAIKEGASAYALNLSNLHLVGPSNSTGSWISQSGGILRMIGNSFDTTPGSTPTAVSSTDNALNQISGNSFNGWGFQSPGPLGMYNPNTGNGQGGWISYSPTMHAWVTGTLGGYTLTSAYYMRQGMTTCINDAFVITSVGTADSVRFDLPNTSAVASYMTGNASNGIVTGQAASAGTQVFIVGSSGIKWTPGTGNLQISGCYANQ